MGRDWKANLANYFDELRILQTSQEETLNNFDQFCEFIVEPAFESLAEELDQYRIKSKTKRVKGRSISFHIFYEQSGIDNFQYTLYLPKNSLELDLKLKIRGRKHKSEPFQDKEMSFLEKIKPSNILKLDKAELIQDIIEHYRNFNFEAFTSPER